MDIGKAPVLFGKTSIRFYCGSERQTRVVSSVEELAQAIADLRPTGLEVPDLIPVSASAGRVLSADWQWRARLQLALQGVGMKMADSYLTPHLDQFTLWIECQSIE